MNIVIVFMMLMVVWIVPLWYILQGIDSTIVAIILIILSVLSSIGLGIYLMTYSEGDAR